MTRTAFFRRHGGRYLLLAALFVFVIVFQVRVSWQTVHTQRSLDFYIPFLVQPFTSRVNVVDRAFHWEKGHEFNSSLKYAVLRRGDQLLEVNKRPFTGFSVYLRELWDLQHQRPPEPPTFSWKPFVATVLTRDVTTRSIEFGFPHCTCGIPPLWQAVALWVVAPVFCVLVGFATAALRPSSILAWGYLVLMLSLSQLQFWHEPYTGFQLTVTPMVWADWFRIPAVAYRSFVQNAWPAVLLIGARQLADPRHRNNPLLRPLIAAFLSLAALKASLAIAWSENFQLLSPVHHLLERNRTEALVLALGVVAALAWTVNRRAGIPALLIAISATTGLFWSPAPITQGEWVSYADQTRCFEPVMPAFHHTHELILLVSVAAYLLTSTVILRRTLSWRPLIGLVLCLPLATHVGASLGNYWYPFAGPSLEYWPLFVLATAGSGVIWIAVWIIRRDPSVPADRPAISVCNG